MSVTPQIFCFILHVANFLSFMEIPSTCIFLFITDESGSSKLSTSSDAPLRIAPSPPRFSLSPKPSVIGTIQLSINDIREITQNFSSSCKIGEGGVGSVYRAKLADGRIVAIKRAKKVFYFLA